MKKILILALFTISNTSESHQLLTDVMKDSETFHGFGFAADDPAYPDDHSYYHLSLAEINSILLKINSLEAIKQFTMHSHQPKSMDSNQPQPRHELAEITAKIPHSDQYWTRADSFQCRASGSNCVEVDLEADHIGPHHGGGVFGNFEVGNVRLVAQYVCAHHPVDYGQPLIPYFLGPASFSHLDYMDVYPYVEVPVISASHHDDSVYSKDQEIQFKCAFKL